MAPPEKNALDYVLRNAKPSGLLNIAGKHHDMYNHGLSTFVLGQAYGMTGDPRVGPALDRALKVIDQCQCQDGGWDYEARSLEAGHDLSLAVMQAKALRSAVDSGFEVRPAVIERAIRDVREHYQPKGCPREASEEEQQKHPGRFTYSKGGGQETLAMAAAGVVCLQEFAQYDDWRIPKNIEIIEQAVREMSEKGNRNDPPFECLLRLHHLLRRPGLVPGGRRALEAVLSADSRPPGFQPDPREQSRERRRMASFRRQSAASRECSTRRPSRVLCWRYRIVIYRSSRRERSIVCGNSLRRSKTCLLSFIPGLQLPARRRPRSR